MKWNNSDGMIIEPAGKDDALEILNLQKLCYQSEAKIHNDYTIPPLIQTVEEMKSDLRNYFFLKAVNEDNKIIGSVRARKISPETCYIGRLIVHPDFQNQGIGTRLMNEIEEKFKENKILQLMTGHLSVKNIKFYQKRGYEKVKVENINPNLQLIYFEKINTY